MTDLSGVAADEHLNQLMFGRWFTRIVATAAELNIADRLADGPRTAESVAGELDADPRGLYRFMRALSALHVLVEDSERQFSLTAVGALLRSDHAHSRRDQAVWLGDPVSVAPWARLTDAVRTGRPTFAEVYGTPFFPYLLDHPDSGALFTGATYAAGTRIMPRIADAIDFRTARTVVDVGGGNGQLLAALLRAHGHLTGTLLDAGHMVDAATQFYAG